MSCIAITSTRKKIILLSDGRSASEATREVTRMDKPKVHKVSGDTGLAWLGWYPTESADKELVEHLNPTEWPTMNAEILAHKASDYIKDGMSPEALAKLDGENPLRICILIIGYDGSQPVIWQIDSHRGERFEPVSHNLPIGKSAWMGYDKGTSDPTPYVASYNTLREHGRTPIQAARQAFKAAVESYKAKGKPVGGETFSVVLRPAKQSKFRHALMN
ncbi:hypothetical protein [Fodinibius salsisoli]|uniref:Uncharacterized protein n=1 Tax=Fodinibius salsisoli TaxID=2820877 RepID=A0ABT3PQI7_9BACT|nr:hypothetical protein [Fodinibius salsisoli]MCW9708096.1 hypothetical protein [Fodinibius salsisoli]